MGVSLSLPMRQRAGFTSMNEHEHLVGTDCEHERDEPMAGDMLHALVCAYPGYPWFVMIRGGIVQVKVMGWSEKWGMALHYKDIAHDANDRKRSIVRAAGEFLERANMVRGKANGDRIEALEGVPQADLVRATL